LRRKIRNLVSVPLWLVLLICLAAGPAVAYEVDVDDPDLFGPGEAWEMPAAISPGDGGPWVEKLQDELRAAGFRPGPSDGRFGKATLGAVYAFQKLHELERNGIFLAEHWPLLDMQAVLPVHEEAPDRVEVDLSKQVLYLVKAQEVAAVLPISSGNGATYRGSSGAPVRARTPEGDYQFYKRVEGWRISYLGGLYRPYYFRGGYAIHGSKSVPPYPASHGCVRVELHDMDYLTTELELGMPVFVYGQRIARDDVIPPPPPPPEPARELPMGLPIGLPWSPAIA
jgi:peptidoglycan hydrolase-like protein with peptidoglycan-binding domain